MPDILSEIRCEFSNRAICVVMPPSLSRLVSWEAGGCAEFAFPSLQSAR